MTRAVTSSRPEESFDGLHFSNNDVRKKGALVEEKSPFWRGHVSMTLTNILLNEIFRECSVSGA